jgi:hypothetical protein
MRGKEHGEKMKMTIDQLEARSTEKRWPLTNERREHEAKMTNKR